MTSLSPSFNRDDLFDGARARTGESAIAEELA